MITQSKESERKGQKDRNKRKAKKVKVNNKTREVWDWIEARAFETIVFSQQEKIEKGKKKKREENFERPVEMRSTLSQTLNSQINTSSVWKRKK